MKRNDIKYVGLGLVLGGLVMVLLSPGIVFVISSVSPKIPTLMPKSVLALATPAPPFSTLAFSATPTALGTPTDALTPTPDFIQAEIANGQLTFSGPLNQAQQIAVYQASLAFVATTPGQTILISKEINGLRYGNPSNTCGPLAIAIMRDAGLVSSDINPHDFWLLNPNIPENRAFITTVFPTDRYEIVRYKLALNKFDWISYPLEPGDFLFIHSGTGGNFDHMLVVNRVDRAGRAYAVTNYDTANGYLINEVMLYDPHDPNAGIFHTWTQTPFALLGSTGFGGFELWRLLPGGGSG